MSIKSFLVGRNPNVSQGEIAVKINDPSKKVSSNHCRITFDGSNFFIEDLISVNGTFVDGKKINSRTRITTNSNIRLGESYVFSLTNPIIQNALQNSNASQTQFETPQNTQKFVVKNQNSGKQLNVSINTNNKFFTFINPFIEYIDNGNFYKKPIIAVYIIFAFLYLLIPFIFIIFSRISNSNITVKEFFSVMLIWLFIAFNSWVCFQLLWNRKKELQKKIEESDEYKATPIIAHIIKTIGEITGITTGIVGFGVSLIIVIFYSSHRTEISYILNEIPFFNNFGFNPLLNIFIFPIIGYLTVIFYKFLSEMVSVLSSIANNTKRIK